MHFEPIPWGKCDATLSAAINNQKPNQTEQIPKMINFEVQYPIKVVDFHNSKFEKKKKFSLSNLHLTEIF